MSNWKSDFKKLWTSETKLSERWNKEKRRPSFWLMLVLFISSFAFAFSGSDDPWLAELSARGWTQQNIFCANLGHGQFAEIDTIEETVEVYRSINSVTYVNKRAQEELETAPCRLIPQPTNVEEI